LCNSSFVWGAQNAGVEHRGNGAPVLEVGVGRRPAAISSVKLTNLLVRKFNFPHTFSKETYKRDVLQN